MQLYFLVTAANLLTGLVLAAGYLEQRAPRLAKVSDLFAARGPRLTLGTITAAAGVLALLFPAEQLPVLGDLLPAVLGIAGGGGLLAKALTESSAASGATKARKTASVPVVRADGLVERGAKLTSTYQVPLGLGTLAVAVAHFLIPGAIFF